MPEDFHWHDLRHTYATLMAKHDVNIRELATVLGHAKAEFTMQMYVVSSNRYMNCCRHTNRCWNRFFPIRYNARCRENRGRF